MFAIVILSYSRANIWRSIPGAVMNKTSLSVALYAGVFTIAFAGFFYRDYVARQAMPPSWWQTGIAETSAVMPLTAPDTASSTPAVEAATESLTDEAADANSESNGERRVISPVREQVPDSHLKTASTRRAAVRERITSRARPLHRDAQSMIDGSGMEEDAADTAAVPLLAYAASGAASVSETAPASTRTFASNRERTTTASTEYTNNTDTTNAVTQSDPVVVQPDAYNTGDGTEFLPDGSSQADLYRTPGPRVYSIDDYRKADIGCDGGYGDSAPHAQLIHKLKGC